MQQKVKTKLPNNQLFDLTVKNESLSNRIEELEKEVTHLQKQKGGYVKNNNEYREEILELNAQLKSKDIKIEHQKQYIFCLTLDIKQVETNHDVELHKRINLKSELNSIKSKWWYKLFNW
jgi:peptidoglycan hydrolase CwlO-like protein